METYLISFLGSEMTPEAQRIAIAEACGWTQIENANTMAIGGIWRGYPPTGQVIGKKDYLPDYLDDLNAMHEAEKAVIFKDVKLYLKYAGGLEKSVGGLIDAIFATAAQRAEAFLRTLGLWKE